MKALVAHSAIPGRQRVWWLHIAVLLPKTKRVTSPGKARNGDVHGKYIGDPDASQHAEEDHRGYFSG